MLNAIHNPAALQLLFSEDIYLVSKKVSFEQFDYLGENNRFLLVINNDPSQKYITQAENETLLKILQAVKMEMKDIALINIAHYPGVKALNLKKFFAFSRAVFLNTDPAFLGIDAACRDCEVVRQEGFSFFHSKSLSEISLSTESKKLFWTAFQSLLK